MLIRINAVESTLDARALLLYPIGSVPTLALSERAFRNGTRCRLSRASIVDRLPE